MAGQKADQWVTEFGVQPFVLDKRRLKPELPRQALDRAHALRLGERLEAAKAGVVVFSRRSAPALGEYEEPTVLATYGQVPEEFGNALAA